MKAIVARGYGPPDVLHLTEVTKPEPAPNEILIRIHASVVSAADTMMRRGTPLFGRLFLGLIRPGKPIPGTGFAGVIEQTGSDVSRFKPGDAVVGESTLNFGAHAEYMALPEDSLVAMKPDNLSFAEVAPVCDGALTAMNFLETVANIQPGQRILIIGASGGIGTAAVQLARHIGAVVTGVCSTTNLDLVKSLGADSVIDYTCDDFTRSGATWDVIFDTVGKSSFSVCRNSLATNGVYLCPVLGLRLLLQMLLTSVSGRKKARFSATGLKSPAELRPLLDRLSGLYESGKLITIIDRQYPLASIPEAHRYVDRGHKRGNVVISVLPDQC